MSTKAMQIADMVEMLPENEKNFAFELIKRLVKAWDPDYTKLTAFERAAVEEAEHGEYIDDSDIDWNDLSAFA